MHVINNINAKTFSYNGRNYTKNFIAIKQGNTNIAIHNAYDTKFQLVGSTHFNQFQVNGIVYTSQADLMANLVNILFVKNLGSGAISNTSELINDGADGINPFVTTADLPSANKILNQTGYNLSGETLTINADWVWLIANQQYTNDDVVEINVPLATSGNTRIDLIVADNNNTFQRIAGTEAIDNAIAPPVPNNTIQATLIVVTDGIIETEPTPVGDLYLEKFDEGIGNFGSSSSIIANFILKKYTNYIITDTSSVTQINSASFLSPVLSYVGKRIRIINQQSTPIVFKHNFGIGVLKFDLVNDTDYILGSDETISFIVQDDYTLLQIVNGVIGSTSISNDIFNSVILGTDSGIFKETEFTTLKYNVGNCSSMGYSFNTIPIVNLRSAPSLSAGATFVALATILGTYYESMLKYGVKSDGTAGAMMGLDGGTEYSVSRQLGFYNSISFGVADPAVVADARMAIGVSASPATVANVNPSTLTNCILLGNDSGDANLQIMHNDGTGVCTKIDLGANFPANNPRVDWYQFELFALPNTSDVHYRITRKNTGHIATGILNTDIPSLTTGIGFHFKRGSGTTALEVRLAFGQFTRSRLG